MNSGARGRKRATRPRFSVVTIVRNEATRLPRLLESLGEFRSRGGEVVVLDTGSDDGTPELARAAGCRVAIEPKRFNSRLSAGQARSIHEAFAKEGEGPFVVPGQRMFHFANARRHATSLARNNFQLAVDGGDVADTMDIDFLDSTARLNRAPIQYFETRVLNGPGWFVEIRDYLFDRRKAEWRGRSHNFLTARGGAPGAAPVLGRDRLLVSHHSDLDKPRGYQLAGVALEALADPGSHRWRYLLGRELLTRRHFRSALPVLLSLDRPGVPASVVSAGLCFAAHCVTASGGSRDEAEALLFRAARRDSNRRDPLMRLARRSLAEGDFQGAASFAAAALAIPPRAGISEPEENHSVGPHAILYWALLWLGRREEAKVHFERCRQLDPKSPLYLEHARLFSDVPGSRGPGAPGAA